jgi:hypothetical protein
VRPELLLFPGTQLIGVSEDTRLGGVIQAMNGKAELFFPSPARLYVVPEVVHDGFPTLENTMFAHRQELSPYILVRE